MEKGCLGEGQTRSDGKLLAPLPPVLFEVLFPLLPSGLGEEGLSYSIVKIFLGAKEFSQFTVSGTLAKN